VGAIGEVVGAGAAVVTLLLSITRLRHEMQPRHHEIASALGVLLVAPFLLAPDLAGLGAFVLALVVAAIGSPVAVVVLWTARGRGPGALARALLVTWAGILAAGAFVAVFVALPVAPSTRGDTASYLAGQTFAFSALPMMLAVATSLVLLPFAWYRSRHAKGGDVET
jgi:hypothetical protein